MTNPPQPENETVERAVGLDLLSAELNKDVRKLVLAKPFHYAQLAQRIDQTISIAFKSGEEKGIQKALGTVKYRMDIVIDEIKCDISPLRSND